MSSVYILEVNFFSEIWFADIFPHSVNFLFILLIFLLNVKLISSFILLWSEKILGVISAVFKLLRLVSWPISDLKMFYEHLRRMCLLKILNWMSNIYVYIQIWSIYSKIWFKFNVSLMIYFLYDVSLLSMGHSGFCNCIIVLLYFCIITWLLFCCLFLPSDVNAFKCFSVGCAYIYSCYLFLMSWPFYH